MAKKTAERGVEAPAEPRPMSPELQARVGAFVQGLGYLILAKVNPAAARQLAEGLK